MMWLDPWSIWLLIGIVCIGLELLIPGLVIIFFGFGAVVTAVFSLLPFISDVVWLQIIIFICFSVSSLVFLRKRFTVIFKGTVFYSENNNNSDVEEYAEVLENIYVKKEGRIKFKGTSWWARCEVGELNTGDVAKVIRREGLTCIVEKV